MAKSHDIRSLAESEAKEVSDSARLDALSEYSVQTVPLSIFRYPVNSCPVSGRSCLCGAGSMEYEDGTVGKSRRKGNRFGAIT